MIKSLVVEKNEVIIPEFIGKIQMESINVSGSYSIKLMTSISGKNGIFDDVILSMLKDIEPVGKTAWITIHGQVLKKGEILRRPGKHIDGRYDPDIFDWTCDTVDFNKYLEKKAPPVDSKFHQVLYNSDKGGILLATNYSACLGYVGEFEGTAGLGGNCDHIKTNEPIKLEANKVYYGNSTFIHESVPVEEDVCRVVVRITLPRNHIYDTSKIVK